MTTDNPTPSPKAAKVLQIGIAILMVAALVAVIIASVKVSRNSRLHRENERLINEQLKNGSFTINPPQA